MAYIGKGIENLSSRTVLDNITTSATATYNLLLNSVAYVPSSAESLTVSLNGIIQKPQSSYSVSGSTIVFDSALTSSDSIDFILAERAITLTTVGSGSVGTTQLADTAVTNAKITDGTIANAKLANSSITLNGSAVSLGGSATVGGGITVADQWRLTSDFTGNASPIASNLAQVNSVGQGTIGSAMTVSSGVFTFPSTGIYLVDFTVLIYGSVNADAQIDFSIYVQEGGSSYQIARGFEEVAHGADTSGRISTLMDVTNTSTIKVKFFVESNINLVRGGSGNNQTCMTFIRLGDT